MGNATAQYKSCPLDMYLITPGSAVILLGEYLASQMLVKINDFEVLIVVLCRSMIVNRGYNI
ncbi:MAG: hypothetical protein ACLBM2_22175, partial [Dolichospermum sp.]